MEMTKQPTIEELLKMLEEYSDTHSITVKVEIYPKGFGVLSDWLNKQIFEFDSIPELIEKLKE